MPHHGVNINHVQNDNIQCIYADSDSGQDAMDNVKGI